MKINKIHKPMNTLYNNKQPKVYDIVMVYCRYCQEKMEIHVYHALGKFEHFQLINLPERIAKHLDTREIHCSHCYKTFVLEKNTQNLKTDYHLKLDCSNIGPGMESWYEDAIPKYSNELYS